MSCDYLDPDLRRLFDFQHGLATNKQLRPFGYSPRRIQHLVESGQWTTVLHGVQSSTNGPLNRAMILEAALLFGGGETYLSHRTAAEEWGLTHIESELPVHITVRYGRSSRCQNPTFRPERSPTRPVPLGWSTAHPGVIVHRSRAQAHIGVATQPARTSLADTAIDLAVAEPSARDAARSLVRSATACKVSQMALRTRMECRRPRRYVKALSSTLDLLDRGVQSVLEHRYAIEVERAHGLPEARRQSPVLVDGRTLYEDVDYRNCGVALIVRLDGFAFHSSRATALRDRRRGNASELSGNATLVFGWEEVEGASCRTAAEVRAVLERGGWWGPNPCPRCAPLLTAGG
ncbi:type IV toxin-antitoxin system AbiEi family antitoxin domain-containing protein [Rhodococcus sp. NPDC059969]|uniref:type IV toxin-antitoxin system AbiEi family antitoxin domain-containing protein n=1 Tax=Rhodococcus sp. NPDC059969 TaxID=3347018 RepID=UPI00366DE2C6